MPTPDRRPDEFPIVSSDDEELILVDDSDTEIGFASKGHCHDGEGVLHRAFSIFLRDAEGRILLQQRAPGKRLWPGYWANSCCSHPRRGETMDLATRRRLRQELGVSVELEYVDKFQYHARYESLGSERELCWIYLGTLGDDQPAVGADHGAAGSEVTEPASGSADAGSSGGGVGSRLRPNQTEIQAVRWVPPAELDRELAEHAERFTPWLHLEWRMLRSRLMG